MKKQVKVKIISSNSDYGDARGDVVMNDKVNKFIEDNSIVVKDIQYRPTVLNNGDFIHSVMVVYEEEWKIIEGDGFMGEENLVGKLACKSHGGLFGGLVGRVEENTSGRGVSPYILVLADGTRLGAFPKDLVIVGESACELHSETKCDEMKLRECYITKGKKGTI